MTRYLVVDVRDGDSLVEEGPHHLGMSRPGRQVEGRRPLAVLHIARRLVGQQQRHHVPEGDKSREMSHRSPMKTLSCGYICGTLSYQTKTHNERHDVNVVDKFCDSDGNR